jgi:hypothetical protein
VDKKKRSLGRDAFSGSNKTESGAVRKMIEDTGQNGPRKAKQIKVSVMLTPSNLKHLDELIAELEKTGKGEFTRDQLIRVAITLLSLGDF